MLDVKIRIGNLKFEQATYFGNKPEFPKYHISVIERNEDYFEFKKGYFKQRVEDEYIYDGPDEKRKDLMVRYDKSCFLDPETSWVIAEFRKPESINRYNLIIPDYHLEYITDPKHEEFRNNFWKLIAAIKDSGIFDRECELLKPDEKESDEEE